MRNRTSSKHEKKYTSVNLIAFLLFLFSVKWPKAYSSLPLMLYECMHYGKMREDQECTATLTLKGHFKELL